MPLTICDNMVPFVFPYLKRFGRRQHSSKHASRRGRSRTFTQIVVRCSLQDGIRACRNENSQKTIRFCCTFIRETKVSEKRKRHPKNMDSLVIQVYKEVYFARYFQLLQSPDQLGLFTTPVTSRRGQDHPKGNRPTLYVLYTKLHTHKLLQMWVVFQMESIFTDSMISMEINKYHVG